MSDGWLDNPSLKNYASVFWGGKMKKKTIILFVLIFLAMNIVALEFPEGLEFSVPDISTSQRQTSRYWLHDIALKLAFVVAFSLTSVGLVWLKLNKFRKWMNIASIVVLGFVFGGILCPSNALQNAIVKYNTAYLIVFLVPVILALLIGRVYCGYVCPFGAVQELINTKKLRKKIPDKVDRKLKLIKYGILLFVGGGTLIAGQTVGSLSLLKPLFTFSGTLVSIVGTVGILAAAVFYYRPYCRYLCPYGALMALLSKLSIYRIVTSSSCVKCKMCERKCSMNAIVDGYVGNECLLCGNCIQVCPKASLAINRGGKEK